jgi:hypothetical protein
VAGRALSVRYLADRCRSLRLFSIGPSLGGSVCSRRQWNRRPKTTLPGVTQVITASLAYLASKYETLEFVAVMLVDTSDDSRVDTRVQFRIDLKLWNERVSVLKGVPCYLREDLVFEEAEMVLRGYTGVDDD